MPCVAWGSRKGWQVYCGISGNFAVECAATLLWNQWQVLRGIGGNFRMERVATFARNTQALEEHNQRITNVETTLAYEVNQAKTVEKIQKIEWKNRKRLENEVDGLQDRVDVIEELIAD